MTEAIRPANRVFILESHNLNDEFNKFLDQIVDGIEISRFSEEAKLLLKLYLFCSHLKDRTTIGMKVYNLSYSNPSKDRQTLSAPASKYKLALLGAVTYIFPYLIQTYNKMKSHMPSSDYLKLPWFSIDNTLMLLKSLNLVNFLFFLREGRYFRLSDRVLGLEIGLPDQYYHNNISINKVQMELLSRSIIWKVLMEFLTGAVPHINTAKIKNKVVGLLDFRMSSSEIGKEKLSNRFNSKRGYSEKCGICSKQPFNPYIIGCEHVFCYYCLNTRYLADTSNGYNCPSCRYCTKDPSQAVRYKIFDSSSLYQ